MATTPLPPDFTEFLKSLSSHGVEYLLIGGYAVGLHGFPRATADLAVWVSISPGNAARIVEALKAFGFRTPNLEPWLAGQLPHRGAARISRPLGSRQRRLS
jgi:hypothetical protein